MSSKTRAVNLAKNLALGTLRAKQKGSDDTMLYPVPTTVHASYTRQKGAVQLERFEEQDEEDRWIEALLYPACSRQTSLG